MKLFFLRHGIAVEADDWEGTDASRPLTVEGEALMALEAKGMATLGLGIEAVITSPLRRAMQTARAVCEAIGLADGPQVDDRLAPGFGKPLLRDVLNDHPGKEALLFVGHEPDMSHTIGSLIGGGRVDCKKGALARVDVEGPEELRGDLVCLMQARAVVKLLEAAP